jgi:hypothetical protein
MMKMIHPVAGTLALATILSFWLSTLLSELFADAATVALVKSLIPWGFLILVPAMALAGMSGFRLGKTWRGPVVAQKRKRMPVIAVNGILILIPAALYLSAKAQAGAFDTSFYIVQGLELVAGAVNITLLGLNMRDGLQLSGKRRRVPAR